MAEVYPNKEDLRPVHDVSPDKLLEAVEYLDELHCSSVGSKGLVRGCESNSTEFLSSYVSSIVLDIGNNLVTQDTRQVLSFIYYEEKENKPIKSYYQIHVETYAGGSDAPIVTAYYIGEYLDNQYHACVRRCFFRFPEAEPDKKEDPLHKVIDLPNDEVEPMTEYDLFELLDTLETHNAHHSAEGQRHLYEVGNTEEL